MLLNPDKFRNEVIATWDVRVAPSVVESEKHILTGDLAAYVQAYNFTSFTFATLEEILDDHRKTAYWASRFGGELPIPNPGVTPDVVAPKEIVYITKLLDVYAEETGASIGCADDLSAHIKWQDDLQKQRVRFYDAEAFMATYRDQTETWDHRELRRRDHGRDRSCARHGVVRPWPVVHSPIRSRTGSARKRPRTAREGSGQARYMSSTGKR